jgi:transcriptional regulator with XRE-family HTH domain
MSQETLGRELHVSLEEVQKYEEGENLTIGRLDEIARVLRMQVSYFCEDVTAWPTCPFH